MLVLFGGRDLAWNSWFRSPQLAFYRFRSGPVR